MPEDFLYYWNGKGVFKPTYLWNWLAYGNNPQATKDTFACFCMMSIQDID